MAAEAQVRHDERRRRFEIEEQGEVSILTYTSEGDRIVFTHTIVPDALEGRGIGSRLVRAGLEHARAQSLKVVPQCSFVRAYIDRHEEAQDLLAE